MNTKCKKEVKRVLKKYCAGWKCQAKKIADFGSLDNDVMHRLKRFAKERARILKIAYRGYKTFKEGYSIPMAADRLEKVLRQI